MEEPSAIARAGAAVSPGFQLLDRRLGGFVVASGLAALCWVLLFVAWSVLRTRIG